MGSLANHVAVHAAGGSGLARRLPARVANVHACCVGGGLVTAWPRDAAPGRQARRGPPCPGGGPLWQPEGWHCPARALRPPPRARRRPLAPHQGAAALACGTG
ncbi:unnamed protein product [Prorocentrum cordatum]|uniref:Uncharacterized protein n=1 Tax=Prorocentrum cordatum TaxID=2364126 RepID=A0ABN9R718_9DINO|nr:unnamed protein product [Polarella glacialis]